MSREAKKQETRKRILDSALELFGEHGFEATTVAQITEKAGVAKGTFFNYFECKEEILCDVQNFWAIDEISRLHDKPGPLVPRMKALVTEIAGKLDINRPLARVMLHNCLSSPMMLKRQIDIFEGLYGAIEPLFALAQERGEIRRTMPPDMLAQLTVQTYFGALLHWSMEQGDERLAEQLALTFELFFAGIVAD